MCCKRLQRSYSSNCVVFRSATNVYCCDYFNCLRYLLKMMLMNDTTSTDNINCSNTATILQQMQLFDLSQPKDIVTFIEVEPDNSNDTNTTIKESVDKAKTALNNKRKSVIKKKTKAMKKSHVSIDKGEESSQMSNEYNKVTHQDLRSENAINIQRLPYTHHFPVSNCTLNNCPLTNRFEDYSPDQRVQAANHNFHQPQMHSERTNRLQITNQSSSTFPPRETPVRSNTVQNLNQISHETNYGLNVIIEHVFNFLIHESQYNFGLSQRKLKLFQRCYAYVVHYCLDRDLYNDYKVFDHIVLVVDSIARNRSQYINDNITRPLLSEMFEWCRYKTLNRSWPPAYDPPAYDKSQINTTSNDRQISTLPPYTPTRTSVLKKNSNKSSQIHNETAPAVNKDQTCLFTSGKLGKEISINIDTCLLHTLQSKPETTLAKSHSKNIQEDKTSKLIQPPIKPSTGMTIPFEIVAGLNKNEVQNQAEIVRSSVSRDSGFISPPNVNNLEVRLVSPVQQTSSNEDVTPMITHVTSLNSNASYIRQGLCSVCKNETNTRCTGCYKAYYCSRECQLSEWYLHKIFCSSSHH
ncbi:uncharacterized protein LOC125049134 [Pieris napi]|uniref:uncharacterized protein LOC125049134 n=1 Tax=Pieris napi TaxID=78633 RepID=UPI001FBBE9D4|nr:uncharacterized protein LOC125049134 [Pieris napi]